MQIGVLGINHKLATLALRENLVRGTMVKLATRFGHHLHYIYLATCNRVEIYFSSKNLVATHSQLLQLLCEQIEEEVAHKLYSYFGVDCFVHLAKVTAGLDSAILFETEIQGQVKRAYQQAALEHLLPAEMHYVFQKSLAIGKKARNGFPLTKRVSLEESIESIATSLLGNLVEKSVLFVGVSQINCKIAYYLAHRGVGRMEFCNRSLEKAALLKGRFVVRELEHLLRWQEYDLTIFGTHAPDYLLKEGSMPLKKHLMIDLSVPRNVHPNLGKLGHVTLLNLDQLHRLMDRRDKGQAQRLARIESEQVVHVVMRHVGRFHRNKVQQLALVG